MDLELTDLQEQRLRKAEEFRALGVDPYTPRSSRTHTTAAALARFAELEATGDQGAEDQEPITVAGRVVGERHMGKTVFAHVRDGQGQIQIYLRKDDIGEEAFERFLKLIDLNDFVEATGTLFRTKTGEVSLRVRDFRILTKALNPPPEKWHGLQDVELRFRQRYADLIANADVRRVFEVRARAITAIRRYLDSLGYLEVETPTLQPLYGGAAARPFTTHHHALDQLFYLRIADELYLKRLIVGGYERVYEICKDFRNEGVDRNHSPEFTMLEFYEAFADYRTIMDRVEGLFVFVANEVFGEPRLTFQGNEIDLTPPWPRITLSDAIQKYSGVDYLAHPDQPSLLAAARAAGADVETGTVWPRIVDELLKQFVRPNLIQPTLLVDYPVALSPLAKRKPGDPSHVERFQPYIGGLELGNAFTELNDPLDQLARFVDQQRDRAAGDEEAMPIDEDFINALMYGMPPTGGVGIGIDRLTVLLTDQQSLRDVILFPAMRKLAPGGHKGEDSPPE
ncbi:MAG: lysyl-tRNA synthetase, class [Thermomicrobiales bacterium]|jgi:lysyl-tRNA synthetase class 2|nr:lysyl-tRNA synthetase, class [Thermomicrobiales bacterium]